MEVTSLGFRTDLMIRKMAGSAVDDRGSYIVVRTPHNRDFRWGNFLLLPAPPGASEAARWRATFAAEFPNASHLAIGVDGTAGDPGHPDVLADLGVEVEVNTVLAATRIRTPAPAAVKATYRVLRNDDDWAQAAELRTAMVRPARGEQVQFVQRKLAEQREMCHRGCGQWFGAFVDDQLVSGLGLFSDNGAVARFQDVETHPEHRGRGLASTLLHFAAMHAQRDFAAATLVIVADPEYVAIRVYRGLGFIDREKQVQLQRSS